jgi:DNA-binding NarL/FixJ family response regulator
LPPITVLIADREKRRSDMCLGLLRRTKRVRVVGTARTSQEAVVAADLKPQILLYDLKMNRKNSVPPLMLIRVKSPQTKVILLTGKASEAKIIEAISQGARGYLGPTLVRRFLVKAVQVVHRGESWVSRAMVAKIIDRLARLSLQTLHHAKR